VTSFSEAQFGKHMVTREKFNFAGDSYDPKVDTSYTRYQAYAQPKDPMSGARHVGMLEVAHHPATSHNLYAGPIGEHTQSSAMAQGWNSKWAGKYSVGSSWNPRNEHINTHDIPGQIPLFLNRSSHARDTVDLMSMAHEGRHMASTLLGVAGDESIAQGRHLQAPTNLSVHSERMIGKLKSTGAVPESHTKSVTNSLDFVPAHEHAVSGGLEGLHSSLTHEAKSYPATAGDTAEEPIAASVARKGQRGVRNVLRAGKPRQIRESQQLRLF
jgi:hypothetical protein